MPADAVVRARIDSQTKVRATQALEAMGLSVSDAIRLLLVRVAEKASAVCAPPAECHYRQSD